MLAASAFALSIRLAMDNAARMKPDRAKSDRSKSRKEFMTATFRIIDSFCNTSFAEKQSALRPGLATEPTVDRRRSSWTGGRRVAALAHRFSLLEYQAIGSIWFPCRSTLWWHS